MCLRVLGKELPENVVGRDARMSVEVRIEWDLPGNIHWILVPGVSTSNEPVDLHLRVTLAMCGALLYDIGGLSEDGAVRPHDSYALAHRSLGIDAGAAIGRRPGPVFEVLVGRGRQNSGELRVGGSAIKVERIQIPFQQQN